MLRRPAEMECPQNLCLFCVLHRKKKVENIWVRKEVRVGEGILRQTVLGDQTIFRKPWVGQIEFIRVLSNWSRKTLLNETPGGRAPKGSRLKHEEF